MLYSQFGLEVCVDFRIVGQEVRQPSAVIAGKAITDVSVALEFLLHGPHLVG